MENNKEKTISNIEPSKDINIFDGEGRKKFDKVIEYLSTLVKRRSKIKTKHKSHRKPIGFKDGKKLYGDYLKVSYYKELINKQFPDLWDWTQAHRPVTIADRMIITDGVLKVFIKERFLFFTSLGVSPDKAIEYSWKSYYSVSSDYYQFNDKGNPISKDGAPKSSNTNAWKKAVNMATSLGDDTYAYDEDLVMSIELIEKFANQIWSLDIPENEKEVFTDKLMGFQEYQMNSFFKTIESPLDLETKTKALDNLVELHEQNIFKYNEVLNNKISNSTQEN